MSVFSAAEQDILFLLSTAKGAFDDGEFEDAQVLSYMAWKRAIKENLYWIREHASRLFRAYARVNMNQEDPEDISHRIRPLNLQLGIETITTYI
jgi:hypothetical protein